MIVKLNVPATDLVKLLDALAKQFPDIILAGVYPD